MSPKILIADDNRSITEILRLNFDLLGYDVIVARDGEEAEKALLKSKPDLVILDVMMPKKNGYQVCREIKSNPETSDIPVILLTAKTVKEDIYWGYDSGADSYICKPYEPEQLEELVSKLIARQSGGGGGTAWTGLRHATELECELAKRRGEGDCLALLEASFSGREAEVFILKYGDSRFKDLVKGLAVSLPESAQSVSAGCRIGQRPDDTFVFLVRDGEADSFAEKIGEIMNAMAKSCYDEADQARGSVLFRDILSRRQENVPIMKTSWKRS